MRDEALAIAHRADEPAARTNLLREYLQACVLRSLHESEAFFGLAFVGGTALRFLFNLPRFSEDLDFAWHDERPAPPLEWFRKIKRDLSLAGFDCSVTYKDNKPVHVGWVRVAGLLHDAGLSDRREKKLSIRIEVDARPPSGARLVSSVVTRHLTLALRHYDLSSLMAGKLHALLTRGYPKGRDWYDLLWYRSARPPVEPNLALLQSALDQTRGGRTLDASAWRRLALARLERLAPQALIDDAAPFLERSADAALLTREHLRTVLTEEQQG